MSLEFYSSAELINELFSRTTFLGLLIYSREDFKQVCDKSKNFPWDKINVVRSVHLDKQNKISATVIRHTAKFLDNLE